MKRFSKLLVNIVAVLTLTVACFSFTACSDIKTLEVTVSLYDTETSATEDKVLKVDLYRHLAPKTVDKIIEYVTAGYYNDAMLYQYDGKIMLGDYAYDNGNIVQKEIKPEFYGEFENNGTTGSNLSNVEGSIGLWRSWTAKNGYKTSDYSRDTARATWFMPTTSNADYDGYFCVFAQFDLENEDNKATWDELKAIFTTDATYADYTVYYTGTYDEEKVNENYGLTFNCVPTEDFVADDIDDLFTAKGTQLTAYNKRTIKVPVYENNNVKTVTAKIAGIKLV